MHTRASGGAGDAGVGDVGAGDLRAMRVTPTSGEDRSFGEAGAARPAHEAGMNTSLWLLQSLLALHTLIGALWKLSNSERSVPSLAAIPHAGWIALSLVEVLCALALVVPRKTPALALAAPIAAACIAGEMLMFCGVHLASDVTQHGEMIYWLVVAALCAGVVVGRRPAALAPA